MKLKTGASYYTKDPQGQTIVFLVSALDEETVTIDFNHPLAGKTLMFDVTIVDVKEAAA